MQLASQTGNWSDFMIEPMIDGYMSDSRWGWGEKQWKAAKNDSLQPRAVGSLNLRLMVMLTVMIHDDSCSCPWNGLQSMRTKTITVQYCNRWYALLQSYFKVASQDVKFQTAEAGEEATLEAASCRFYNRWDVRMWNCWIDGQPLGTNGVSPSPLFICGHLGGLSQLGEKFAKGGK